MFQATTGETIVLGAPLLEPLHRPIAAQCTLYNCFGQVREGVPTERDGLVVVWGSALLPVGGTADCLIGVTGRFT